MAGGQDSQHNDRQQVVPHHLKRSTNDSTQYVAVLERLAPFWQLYKVDEQVVVQNLHVNGWGLGRSSNGISRQE